METPPAYDPRLEEIKKAVHRSFSVLNIYYDAGVLAFDISDSWIKEKFKQCTLELREIGFLPSARRTERGIQIRVLPFARPRASSLRWPVVLMAATIGTVGIDGYLRSSSVYELLQLRPGLGDVIFQSLLFTVSLFAIIFIHEMGHKLAAWVNKVSASPPYFIPGFPGVMPTLGAIIFQKEPLVNRDDMFDIGFSGPLAGFIVGLGATLLAYQTAVWIPLSEYSGMIDRATRLGATFYSPPLVFYVLRPLFGRPDFVPFFLSVGFAAWLGMVVTALNMLPIWQLDGGRIFRSFLTRKQHLIASYASIAVLFVTGYFFMALLVILLMRRSPDVVPLDDVSPLSPKRKLSVVVAVPLILALAYVPLYLF